ncbi:MAG: OmpA family protein, partial [Planctomycetota bacterium]
FDSGSADINGSSFRLLTKVEDAIRVFPNARVVIEGHTDSYGADESNLTLSEQRAEAVRQYLLAQMGLPAEQVSAVGYGETRPVANNETPQGRARNRRIDVRIVPEGEPLEQLPAATFSAEESQL